MEVALEAVVVNLEAQFLHDVLNDKKFAVLDGFFEGPLNVPEHQVLHLWLLCEQFLEPIQVAVHSALEH